MTKGSPVVPTTSHRDSAWQYGSLAGIRYGLRGRDRVKTQDEGDDPGNDQDHPSLVLLHEMGGQIESWSDMAAMLDSRFRMLAYDQRSVGMEEHADDLGRLVNSVGLSKPYWLIAAAAGAGIALVHAARHPHCVAGLVLCAAAIEVDDKRRAYLENRAVIALRDGMAAVVDSSLSRSYPTVVQRDAAAFASYRERMLASSPEAYASANRLLANMALDEVIASVQCPCLVMAGTHDVMRPPADLRRLANALVNAQGVEFVEIDSGHLMAVQTPAEVAQLASQFIARHEHRHLHRHIPSSRGLPV